MVWNQHECQRQPEHDVCAPRSRARATLRKPVDSLAKQPKAHDQTRGDPVQGDAAAVVADREEGGSSHLSEAGLQAGTRKTGGSSGAPDVGVRRDPTCNRSKGKKAWVSEQPYFSGSSCAAGVHSIRSSHKQDWSRTRGKHPCDHRFEQETRYGAETTRPHDQEVELSRFSKCRDVFCRPADLVHKPGFNSMLVKEGTDRSENRLRIVVIEPAHDSKPLEDSSSVRHFEHTVKNGVLVSWIKPLRVRAQVEEDAFRELASIGCEQNFHWVSTFPKIAGLKSGKRQLLERNQGSRVDAPLTSRAVRALPPSQEHAAPPSR